MVTLDPAPHTQPSPSFSPNKETETQVEGCLPLCLGTWWLPPVMLLSQPLTRPFRRLEALSQVACRAWHGSQQGLLGAGGTGWVTQMTLSPFSLGSCPLPFPDQARQHSPSFPLTWLWPKAPVQLAPHLALGSSSTLQPGDLIAPLIQKEALGPELGWSPQGWPYLKWTGLAGTMLHTAALPLSAQADTLLRAIGAGAAVAPEAVTTECRWAGCMALALGASVSSLEASDANPCRRDCSFYLPRPKSLHHSQLLQTGLRNLQNIPEPECLPCPCPWVQRGS